MDLRALLPEDRLSFCRERNNSPCAMHKLKGVACPRFCPFSVVLQVQGDQSGLRQCRRILEVFSEDNLINCLGYINNNPGGKVESTFPSDAGNEFLRNVCDFVEDIFKLRITAKQRMDAVARLLEDAQKNPEVAATNIAAAIALLRKETDEIPVSPPELELENGDQNELKGSMR